MASVVIAIALPLYAVFVSFPSFSDLLITNTEAVAVRVGTHWANLVNGEDPDGRIVVSQAFKEEAALVAKDFRVMKYRVFDARGEIIHSSVAKEIGQINDHDYFHQKVARGETFTKTVKKEQKSQEGETFTRDVVETYVPVIREGRFLGAFEVYFDVTEEAEALAVVFWRSATWLFAVSGGFLVFLLMMRRAVVKPISQVARAMSFMADGRFEHRAPEMGNDEITDMARIFNRMCGELQRTHLDLNNEKNKLTTIILGAREGIVVTDNDQRVVLVNPAAERLLGKKEERIIEEGFLQLLDDPKYVGQFLEPHSGAGLPETVVYNNHVLHFYAASIRGVKGEEIGSAALIRDVTQEKRLEEQLREYSYTDRLTGLLNRRRLDEILDEEVNRARRYGLALGLLLFDVDHFKAFNDNHGHDQGDRVLEALGEAMKEHFRNVDFCARYGGEEFCVVMPNTSTPGIQDAAERFREKIENLVVDDLKVTISIGITILDRDKGEEETPAALLKRADLGLYEAKNGGRNQVRMMEKISEA